MDYPGVSGMYRTIAIVPAAVKKFCCFDGVFVTKLHDFGFRGDCLGGFAVA
jgi:hypothetical protein